MVPNRALAITPCEDQSHKCSKICSVSSPFGGAGLQAQPVISFAAMILKVGDLERTLVAEQGRGSSAILEGALQASVSLDECTPRVVTAGPTVNG
eukprot:1161213-Pelagomonas_calceolata.AAC.20